ncbi:MAG: LysM domain-containing protein [Chloroflexota bacterium]|nr:LysM domain-containing protein [Chloroflexota bacterium]
MSMTRRPHQGKGKGTERFFELLPRVVSVLPLMALLLGCARAKPPRTVTVPEALGRPESEIVEESASPQSATSGVSAYPSPATPTPSPIPSATLFPTAIAIPTIGPTTTTSPPTPISSPTGEAVHVVKRGETLYSIARRYGVSVEALAHANGLRTPNTIYAGQRLVIPP